MAKLQKQSKLPFGSTNSSISRELKRVTPDAPVDVPPQKKRSDEIEPAQKKRSDEIEPAQKKRGGTHPRLMPRVQNNGVATPDSLFNPLHKLFEFTYDPCPLNAYERGEAPDGLQERWGMSTFCNPPYSEPAPWLAWGATQYELYGTRTVFLVPAHIETQYWRQHVWPYASQIWLCTTGVIFPGFKIKFPMPMSLVIYGHYPDVPPLENNEELLVGRYCFRILVLREAPRNRRFFTRSALGQQ